MGNQLVYSLPMRNWNQQVAFAIGGIVDVYSLPMRNWNTSEILKNEIKNTTFIVYLWGIEIFLYVVIYIYVKPFIVYLWGIEII